MQERHATTGNGLLISLMLHRRPGGMCPRLAKVNGCHLRYEEPYNAGVSLPDDRYTLVGYLPILIDLRLMNALKRYIDDMPIPEVVKKIDLMNDLAHDVVNVRGLIVVEYATLGIEHPFASRVAMPRFGPRVDFIPL